MDYTGLFWQYKRYYITVRVCLYEFISIYLNQTIKRHEVIMDNMKYRSD